MNIIGKSLTEAKEILNANNISNVVVSNQFNNVVGTQLVMSCKIIDNTAYITLGKFNLKLDK